MGPSDDTAKARGSDLKKVPRREIDLMQAKEVKMYSDYKSPFAYLAFDPAFALEQRFRIRIR